jgi:14-3-3 protein epsilon
MYKKTVQGEAIVRTGVGGTQAQLQLLFAIKAAAFLCDSCKATMDTREMAVYVAKLAEQAERYDDMAEYMAEFGEHNLGLDLTVEERNLLSVAFKNAVGSRRAAWRIITSIRQKEQSQGNTEKEAYASEYCKRLENELDHICNTILDLLDKLVPIQTNGESKVFYLKMKADYYRYKTEYKENNENEELAQKSRLAYEAAHELAQNVLVVTHPLRLGLALNFSVFHYEVLKNPGEARKLARIAFENAVAELDCVDDSSYKDSTLIMSLLRDNLTLWISDLEGGDA